MDLSEAIAATAPKNRCALGEWIANRDDHADLEITLTSKLDHAHLARAFALVDGGRKFGDKLIARHRTGECRCGS